MEERNDRSPSFDQGVWKQKSNSSRLRQWEVGRHASDVGVSPEERDKKMGRDKSLETNCDCDAAVKRVHSMKQNGCFLPQTNLESPFANEQIHLGDVYSLPGLREVRLQELD